MKKAYATPQLIVHGSVEKITLASQQGQQHHNATPNNNVFNPGNACDPGRAVFCGTALS